MPKLRFGVVGLGMGSGHSRRIVADKNRAFCLGAVCDAVAEKAERLGDELKVPHFTDTEAMYDSGLIDAVIVATPHYFHPALTLAAARRGLHVLCEKPLAVTVGPARRMIAECRKRKVALGAMLQQRTRGIMMKMKQMVASGRIGEVFRVSMICSSWYRTQYYYDSGGWRGTWNGEGGGVLLNQAPHSLDLFQWIGGMPTNVLSVLNTRLHKIEVENTANVICRYGRDKVGYIYATTAESPGAEQLTVCGDKGTLVAEGGKLRLAKLKMPISRHIKTAKSGFAELSFEWKDVTWKREPGGVHINVIRAFAAHVLRGKPMIATGAEAINELELSNAIYLSGFNKSRPVDVPVSAAAMDRLMARLIREQSRKKS